MSINTLHKGDDYDDDDNNNNNNNRPKFTATKSLNVWTVKMECCCENKCVLLNYTALGGMTGWYECLE